MLETAHNHGLVCQKMRTDTSFLTANMSRSAFAASKTMETFHPDMSTYVKSCTRTRPRESKWCRVISLSVVVVSRSLWSVSRLNRRGQSSWTVVLRAQSAFFFVVIVSRSSWMVIIFYGGYAHVFTETYDWGKPRSMSGQMYGGWVEHV